ARPCVAVFLHWRLRLLGLRFRRRSKHNAQTSVTAQQVETQHWEITRWTVSLAGVTIRRRGLIRFLPVLTGRITPQLVLTRLRATPLVTLTWPLVRRRSGITTPTSTWPLVFECSSRTPAATISRELVLQR